MYFNLGTVLNLEQEGHFMKDFLLGNLVIHRIFFSSSHNEKSQASQVIIGRVGADTKWILISETWYIGRFPDFCQ